MIVEDGLESASTSFTQSIVFGFDGLYEGIWQWSNWQADNPWLVSPLNGKTLGDRCQKCNSKGYCV